MRTIILLLPLLIPLLLSCKQDDNFPKPTGSGGSSPSLSLPNTAVSFIPENWRSYVGDAGSQGNPNQYRHTLVTGTSSTSSSVPVSNTSLKGLSARATSYTLGMATSTIVDTASYCYWTYSFYPPASLRVGKSLTLKANVRLDNVQGKGISLVLRGDRSSQPNVLFTTTEGKSLLRGTTAFTEYSVTLPYTTDVDYLLVYFVMLSNTTGTVTITDVSIDIN